MVLDLNIALAPLALTPVNFTVGETAQVAVSFSYTVGQATTITIKAGPYSKPLGIQNMVDACVGSVDVPLPVAETPAPMTATVQFPITPSAQGGIADGTYGLKVWVDSPSVTGNSSASQDNVIIVSGNPASMWDTMTAMLPLLLLGMMMGMIMPMMQGFGQGK